MIFDEKQCQHTGVRDYARFSRPRSFILLSRMLWLLRKEGVAFTSRKIVEGVERIFGLKKRRKKIQAARVQEIELGLQPGELVEVKSEEEIRATLDEHDRCRGLTFVFPEMSKYYGARLRVLKRVEQVFLEESRQGRKLKNTVLLEGVNCQGIGIGCDRSCYLFWREVWVKRVEGSDSQPTNDIIQIDKVSHP